MKILLLTFPVALLVAYSQIIVKWRMLSVGMIDMQAMPLMTKILKYLSDPFIISAYGTAFLSSLVWLYVITKLPLIVAFPVYIGITFVLVIAGGWYFLSETITLIRLASVTLILLGIILGVKS
jgi:multidrug transporter EmrE-like cation transporter